MEDENYFTASFLPPGKIHIRGTQYVMILQAAQCRLPRAHEDLEPKSVQNARAGLTSAIAFSLPHGRASQIQQIRHER